MSAPNVFSIFYDTWTLDIRCPGLTVMMNKMGVD